VSGLMRVRFACGLVAALLAAAAATGAVAQSATEEPYTPVNRTIESNDLAPVLLPVDLWRGLDAAATAKWLTGPDPAPRSPALHQLWRRLLLSTAPAPIGPDAGQGAAKSGDDLLQMRLQALYRSGLLADIAEVLGYCTAVAGNTAAAALSASLAREEGSTAELALSVLDSLDGGVARRPPLPDRLSLLDYRFLELQGPIEAGHILKKAEPALLVALAQSSALDVKVQVAAAEAALRLNAMTPEAVAAVYRRLPETAARAGGDSFTDPVLQRAQLFRAVEAAQAPERRVRLVRSLLSEARRAGLHVQTATMLAPLFAQLWPSAETATLAEAVVETALAGGDLDLARRWAESAANLQHWLALIDLADPQSRQVRQSGLAYLDDLATRGRLSGAQLHRVVTVLDALDITVPLRLWEAAGRIAQPSGGHLPETGVLGELAQAAQQKEAGRTILLVMRALGPDGPEGANALALGDSIRALKRTGLDADARRLAVEALYGAWPRTSGN
jgi:hypothetical protein